MNFKILAGIAISLCAGAAHALPVDVASSDASAASYRAVTSFEAPGASSVARSRAANRVANTPSNAPSSSWVFGALHPQFGSLDQNIGNGLRRAPSTVSVNPVPIPTPFWFLVAGLLVVSFLRRRALRQGQ